MKAQLARRAAFSVFAQQRLKADLRIVAGRARTVLGVYRCDLAAAKGVNLIKGLGIQRAVAAQRGTPAHFAHVLGWRAHRIDGICHAVLAENFHGALIEIVSLGQDRRAGVTFDEKMVDPEVGQQQRAGETATAAADNQYRYFEIKRIGRCGHALSPGSKLCGALRAQGGARDRSVAREALSRRWQTGPWRGAWMARRVPRRGSATARQAHPC